MKRVLNHQYQNEILRNLNIPLAYVTNPYYVDEDEMRRKEVGPFCDVPQPLADTEP